MSSTYSFERTRIAKVLIENMFKVKTGETVAITGDTGSDRELADALAGAAYAVGAKPLILLTPKASHDGQAGEIDWPVKPLTAALSKVDVWIELSTAVMLYSRIWETAFSKNKKLRYLVIGGASIPSIMRTFVGFDVDVLNSFLLKVKSMTEKTKVVRIIGDNGTDVSYETDTNYMFDIDSGDYSHPKFGTAPGYVNIVPKTGSMNGTIVFDLLMNANVYNTENHVEFLMKDGVISGVIGGTEADKFKEYLASFEDENMYKISHNMFGFNPGVRRLCGEIVEDERVWGGVDFGFGHTSPMDMPPYGQPAKSHFDGVVGKVSIFLDDIMIVDNGNVCHQDLLPLANKLLNN